MLDGEEISPADLGFEEGECQAKGEGEDEII
jgi:hypothetical protein